MNRKQFLIETYTNLKQDYITDFPNGFTVMLCDKVLSKLEAGICPKKVEKWAISMDKLWRKKL